MNRGVPQCPVSGRRFYLNPNNSGDLSTPQASGSSSSSARQPSFEVNSETRALALVDQFKSAASQRFKRAVQNCSELLAISESTSILNSLANNPTTSALALPGEEDEVTEVGHVETVQVPGDLHPKSALYRKPVSAGEVYIVKKFQSEYWSLAKVLAIICNVQGFIKKMRCLVGFSDGTSQKRPVEPNEMAYTDTSETSIPKGTGVVSNSIDDGLNYYPGIVIETPGHMNNFKYLVFFDCGVIKYCHHNELHVICDFYTSRISSNVDALWLKDALLNDNAYLLKFKLGQVVTILQQGDWVDGTVKRIDCSIMNLEIPGKGCKWFSRGSYRLKRIIMNDVPCHLKRANLTRKHLWELQMVYKTKVGSHDGTLAIDGITSTSHVSVSESPSDPNRQLAMQLDIRQSKQMEVTTGWGFPTGSKPPTSSPQVQQLIPLLRVVPRKLGSHLCNPQCVAGPAVIAQIDPSYSPLAKPFTIGFKRSVKSGTVTYTTPCGRSICSVNQLTSFIRETSLELSYDEFDFTPTIDPLRVLHLEPSSILAQKTDVSEGAEVLGPISCVNEYNNTLPEPIKYLTKRKMMTPSEDDINHEDFASCCSCVDDCMDYTKCECIALTVKSYMEISAHEDKPLAPQDVMYQNKKLEHPVRSGIFECNKKCPCSKKCGNRVAQFPIFNKLQLFQTSTKGWGVRTLHDIPKGTFVGTYVGILLNEVEADQWGVLHGDNYLTDLDYIKIQEGRKPGYEENASLSPDEDECEGNLASNVDGERPRNVSEFAAKLRKRYLKPPKSIPKKRKKGPEKLRYPRNSLRYLFPRNQAEYVIDAKLSGNIGRYFNHSCDPNMTVQNVFIETHDLRFPEVAFFTNKDVLAGTELTWHYNYDVNSVKGGRQRLYCLCQSPKCLIRLY